MTGPTFYARFVDGTETRMSVFTSRTRLDLQRGVALSRVAYEARTKHLKEPPPIVASRFEQEGGVLKTYSAEELAKVERR